MTGSGEYERAIAALFARTGTTAKLGLERTRALLAQLGNPERKFPAFHVAGTNGKGSVVAMLYALLRSKGVRVGRYTSPHLIDFRERIVVDDEQIGAGEVLDFLRRWEDESERLGATFFEITTVLAFEHFARRGVDVAVIETGMGGRLDATNVITPLVSGVTTVSVDHAEYLGNSLADIAREKAGIFKHGVPAVIGQLAPEAEAEVRRCAEAVGAPLVDAASRYPVRRVKVTAEGTDVNFEVGGSVERVRVGLVGLAQAANASVALAMLDAAGEPHRVTLDEARSVLPGVQLPGRFQRVGKFVLDVAHNVAGMRALRETLEEVELPRPLVAVVGILRDKEWQEMLRVLRPAVDRIFVTRPSTAPPDRVWDLEEVRQRFSDKPDRICAFEPAAFGRGQRSAHGGRESAEAIPELAVALEECDRIAATVLVSGSFYTVGEALERLGVLAPFSMRRRER